MDCSFAQVPAAYPTLYKIKLDQSIELRKLYTEVIFPAVPICEVETELSKYVSSFIEPVGWRAIWRANPRSSGLTFKADLLVEVIDVGRNSLEALVIIQKVLGSQLDTLTTDDSISIESQAELDKMMANNRILTAPLIELYVISEGDTEKAFLKSAVVIEHARFFLKYIWRPWDNLANETQFGEIFVETRLEARLNLYFDIKSDIISSSMKNRIKQILAEGWQIRYKLDDISKRQEITSESEDYADLGLDEVDMFEAIRLKIKLEDFDREMRMFEDPYLRMFAFCLRSNSAEEEESKIELEDSDKVTHVVSKTFNMYILNVITTFYAKSEKDQQNRLLFHNTLNSAIKAAKSGHKIAILPGLYTCSALQWIEYDIEIEALSTDRSKTILQCTEGVDVFVHCSGNIFLTNLTLKSQQESDCLLMIHTGLVTLKNCNLDGSNCCRGAYNVLSRAKLKLEKTLVINRNRDNTQTTSSLTSTRTTGEEFECSSQTIVSTSGDDQSIINDQKQAEQHQSSLTINHQQDSIDDSPMQTPSQSPTSLSSRQSVDMEKEYEFVSM